MPPNSEIEKLERRWKENPKGTVFAPYAEVLRKHGDYPMAKDILRMGLELHPDHIPGNIVLGRCCLDLGEEGPAEAAFVHVLDLDAENVIALKALADITERQGRLMEAAAWLTRLIAVDPSNDEAREQLTRVAAAREAASAAIVEPIIATTGARPPAAETTEVVSVIQPPIPKARVPEADPEAEAAGGEPALTIDVDATLEAVLGPLEEPGPAAPPAPPQPTGSEVTEEVTARSRPAPVPPAQDLEIIPGAMEVAATADIETQPLPDLSPDEPFQPPTEVLPREALADPFSLGLEELSAIELRPAGPSEFQSPDDSAALLDLALSPSTEFQQPDASQELRPSSERGSEYQAPSGADELLHAVETAPPESAAEPPPPPGQATSGYAAITLMTTEELPTRPEETEGATGGVEEAEPAEAVTVVEMLAAAGSSTGTVAPTAPPASGAAETTAVEGEVSELATSARSQDLHLIFPDESVGPEQPKVRRISEEIGSGAEAEPVEPPSGEPAPVLTETMAELYARQGHVAEALNVYRGLAARNPDDPRLAQRIRELEVAQASGRRRMSYVAVDTGGESVESFFRSLTDARPGDVGDAKGPRPASRGTEPRAGAAPTRPATEPVSLSAIFGEEAAASATAGSVEQPATPSSLDSFSFDQFFGGGGASPTGTEPRAAAPRDEDLDQFQNWLKSLKR